MESTSSWLRSKGPAEAVLWQNHRFVAPNVQFGVRLEPKLPLPLRRPATNLYDVDSWTWIRMERDVVTPGKDAGN